MDFNIVYKGGGIAQVKFLMKNNRIVLAKRSGYFFMFLTISITKPTKPIINTPNVNDVFQTKDVYYTPAQAGAATHKNFLYQATNNPLYRRLRHRDILQG